MSLITISGLHKGFGAQTVLEDVHLRVARGEKIGIVGKNGGGKTTLLKMILGIEPVDRGTVKVSRGVRIGYLAQVQVADEGRTLLAEARTALDALFDAENELRAAEIQMAANPEDADALDAYASARDRYEFSGGERAEENLLAALLAMGFAEADFDKPIRVLSGGEKTRLAMSKLLASAPDVLALDEPTNHLDIRAVEWLESFLTRFPGAVLVVSHDRRFLKNVVDTVWEVEGYGLKTYSGGFDGYQEQRAAARARQQEEHERQAAEIARIEEYIRRNIAGQNTRNAQGRRKQLAQVERIEAAAQDPQGMKLKVQTSGRSGREVVVVERASKRYGDKVLLENATFSLERGDRIGVVGPNGVGKSTFVEMVAGEESPDSGYIRRGHGVTLAFHKQEVDDFEPEETILDAFYDRAGMTIGEARAHLAKYLFSGDDVFKPVGALSGGERAKLAMSLMVLSPANLLILDEPTNHLDVYSCDALTDSLKSYDGTLLLVSHDRALLDEVTNKTLAFEGNGRVRLFEGNYRKYREAVAPSLPTPTRPGTKSPPTAAAKPAETRNAHALSKERQKLQKQVDVIERKIADLETELAEIEGKLAAPGSADEAVTLSHRYSALQAEIAARMEEWEAATMELESVGAA
ncbi:MAG: ABC-F family ATP-binding cassette domain-containing protein [Capsulimonadales bacterium]|nr:ABC-F family ATP-binding cassette domain-containing protein [Capsulimonadales bacterium]